ncbi:MAG: hypothetical protein KF746_02600 [Chitinophagaceae bacterium]|nr:hypothetical protein [Chitinophagaceae bacterium]
MEKSTTTNAKKSEISATTLLNNLRKNVASREQLGVLLMDHVLREAATGKHFREDGIAEIPLTVTIYLQTRALESDTVVCDKACWTSFGHEILCLQTCHTEHVQ